MVGDIEITEKALEDYLEQKMIEGICPVTDSAISKVFRQAGVDGYGVTDIITYTAPNFLNGQFMSEQRLVVYELKRGIIDVKAVMQIARYRAAFSRYRGMMEERGDVENLLEYYVEYILVGGSVDLDSDLVFLLNTMDWLEVYTYEIDLDNGITFECNSKTWHKTGSLDGVKRIVSESLSVPPTDNHCSEDNSDRGQEDGEIQKS